VKEDNEGQPVYASIYDKAKAHQKNLLRSSKNKKIEMIIPKNKLQEHIQKREQEEERKAAGDITIDDSFFFKKDDEDE